MGKHICPLAFKGKNWEGLSITTETYGCRGGPADKSSGLQYRDIALELAAQ